MTKALAVVWVLLASLAAAGPAAASGSQVALADDGTEVRGDNPEGRVVVSVNGGAPIDLGPGVLWDLVAGANGQFAATWNHGERWYVTSGDAGGVAPALDLGSTGWGTALAMSPNGNAVVLQRLAGGAHQTTFRPAGGTFGPLVAAGGPSARRVTPRAPAVLPGVAVAVDDAGRQVLVRRGAGVYEAYRRVGEGPVSDPAELGPGSNIIDPIAGMDASGRAVVTYAGDSIDVVGPDGTVTPLPGLSADTRLTALDVAPDGTVVGAGSVGAVLRIVTGSVGGGAFSTEDRTFDLGPQPSYTFPFFYTDPGAPSVVVGPDGSAVVVFNEYPSGRIQVLRRDGHGAFGEPRIAGCARSGAVVAGLRPGGAAVLFFGDLVTSLPSMVEVPPVAGAPAPEPTCRTFVDLDADSITLSGTPVAGRPVTFDGSALHGPRGIVSSLYWTVDGERDALYRPTPLLRLTHTFARPGLHSVRADATEDVLGVQDRHEVTLRVDVLEPARLRADRRQPLRRFVRIRASAQASVTTSVAVPSRLVARSRGRTVGRLRVVLPARSTRLRIPLTRRPGRRVTVVLRQDGTALAHTTIHRHRHRHRR